VKTNQTPERNSKKRSGSGDGKIFDWDERVYADLVRACDFDDTCQIALSCIDKGANILEAGCGPGHVVEYFHDKGYRIEGLELGESSVRECNLKRPHLAVRQGNIVNIAKPDGHYSGILSFGVVEHLKDKMQEALVEMHRVLAPGGIAVISVPCLSVCLRFVRWRQRLNPKTWQWLRTLTGKKSIPINRRGENGFAYHPSPLMGEFSQYELTAKEFREALEGAGFQIKEFTPTHVAAGMSMRLGSLFAHNRYPFFELTTLGRMLHELLTFFSLGCNHMWTAVVTKK